MGKKDKKDVTLDGLASMVQNGFVEQKGYMDKRFERIEKNMKEMEKELKTDIKNLELEVKHRRVHVFDHKDLEHRVEKLEEKFA